MDTYFVDMLELALPMSAMIAILLMLSPLIKRSFIAKWRYYMWLFIALRLLIPVRLFTVKDPVVMEIPMSISGVPVTTEAAANTIDGYDDGSFAPDRLITRAEAARMMAAAEGGWLDGYVSVASRMGICKGASDAPATRLAAAHMMRNALDAGVNTKNNLWLIDNWDTGARVHGDEMIYERSVFFNNDISAKRIRLIGTLTGEQRENELYFTASDAEADTPQTVIARYSDIKDFIGKECVLYCAKRYGNTEVIMAEPAEPRW